MVKYCKILFLFSLISSTVFSFEASGEMSPSEELIAIVKGSDLGPLSRNVRLDARAKNPALSRSEIDLSMLEGVLANGADINYQDKQGYTALMYAVSYGLLEIVKHLISQGADKYVVRDGGCHELRRSAFEAPLAPGKVRSDRCSILGEPPVDRPDSCDAVGMAKHILAGLKKCSASTETIKQYKRIARALKSGPNSATK